MYNFIYSTSNEYAPYCMTSMSSLLKNNSDLDNVKFYVLSNDIEEAMKKNMRAVADKFRAEVEFIDCMLTISEIFRGGAQLNFNVSSFLRIFIPQLLPRDVEKALFIDSDTYINYGIKELYDTDITEYLCGMSYNQPIYEEMLKEASLNKDEEYFNAGVILINLEKWRERNIQNEILNYYYKQGGNFPTDDQSVINAIVGKETKVLSYKYNSMIGNFYWSYKKFCKINTIIGRKTSEEYLEAKKTPVIVHFNGPGVRPWEKFCAHPYAKKYRDELLYCNPGYCLKNAKQSIIYLWMQYLKHKVVDNMECLINR